MPSYTTEVEVDISYEEFWEDLWDSEKKEFLEFLSDEGVISLRVGNERSSDQKNILDHEWEDVCLGLSNMRLNITPEEQEIIEKIYRKYS
jgi:hypothetical protein